MKKPGRSDWMTSFLPVIRPGAIVSWAMVFLVSAGGLFCTAVLGVAAWELLKRHGGL